MGKCSHFSVFSQLAKQGRFRPSRLCARGLEIYAQISEGGCSLEKSCISGAKARGVTVVWRRYSCVEFFKSPHLTFFRSLNCAEFHVFSGTAFAFLKGEGCVRSTLICILLHMFIRNTTKILTFLYERRGVQV